MAGEVTVCIINTESRLAPPASIIEYAVRNGGLAPVWLVTDDWLIWRAEGREITLSLARGRMRPGVEVFGYFNPQVQPLAPQERLIRTLTLAWPLTLDDIWNAERTARPEPGEYLVRLEVGFGRTPAPPPSRHGDVQSLEAPVLAWQETAISPPAVLVVPPWREPDSP